MLTVLGGLAEFERELIRARTGEGRARAKARGVKLGRKPKLTAHQQERGDPRRDDGRAGPRDRAQLQCSPQHDFEACAVKECSTSDRNNNSKEWYVIVSGWVDAYVTNFATMQEPSLERLEAEKGQLAKLTFSSFAGCQDYEEVLNEARKWVQWMTRALHIKQDPGPLQIVSVVEVFDDGTTKAYPPHGRPTQVRFGIPTTTGGRGGQRRERLSSKEWCSLRTGQATRAWTMYCVFLHSRPTGLDCIRLLRPLSST